MAISVTQLTARFDDIHEQRMQGLPFINRTLDVEAVGFCSWKTFELGVLITPWFMNLILLPESDTDIGQGHKINAQFPSGDVEFTTARDEELGLYLSAVLFSSVMSFASQDTARDIAVEVMRELFDTKHNAKAISRREIFTTTGRADA
jgi:[NiFe] hydrogenase assembly HybE family chaperone